MKQLFFPFLISIAFIQCKNVHNWPDADKQKYTKQCLDQFPGHAADSSVKSYCDCRLQKMMERYSSYTEAEAKITSQEDKELRTACAKAVGRDTRWTEAVKEKYKNTMLTTSVIASLGEENAKKYVDCIIDKLIKKYASPAEVELFGTTEEGKQLGTNCITELGLAASQNQSYWTNEQRQKFVQDCSPSAQSPEGMDAEQANNYCDCMQRKLEEKHSWEEANKMTDADFQTEEWKKIIDSCVSQARKR
jgi:hypothetical protein